MAEKISIHDYLGMLLDMNTSRETILKYSTISKGAGGFDWKLRPNLELVEVPESYLLQEDAMDIGNSLSRWRRAEKFMIRSESGDQSPVLVSEGDSWFQFPFLIDEVIDHLEPSHLIWSVGAAGDTVQNMVFGPNDTEGAEYMRALDRQRERVRGFLFSGAGNDIIGEDPVSGKRAIFEIIKDYQTALPADPHSHINFAELGRRLDYLKRAYTTVFNAIRADPDFTKLPIFVHGYDYAFPYPEGDDDPRDPSYAQNDQWLGSSFAARRYPNSPLRRDVVKVLIDALYDMLESIADDSTRTNVWVVNCRGALPNVVDWNDEIHGTSKGFAGVADRFRAVIGSVI